MFFSLKRDVNKKKIWDYFIFKLTNVYGKKTTLQCVCWQGKQAIFKCGLVKNFNVDIHSKFSPFKITMANESRNTMFFFKCWKTDRLLILYTCTCITLSWCATVYCIVYLTVIANSGRSSISLNNWDNPLGTRPLCL